MTRNDHIAPSPATGECIITSIRDEIRDRYNLRIDRADSHVLISPEFLQEITAEPNENVWVDHTGDQQLLHIKGINREVIYQIGDYRPNSYDGVYEAKLIES